MEIEIDKSLPFLEVLISQKIDGSLTHQVYHKNTHTDQYIHAHYHHNSSQKSVVLKTLISQTLETYAPHEFLPSEKADIF